MQSAGFLGDEEPGLNISVQKLLHWSPDSRTLLYPLNPFTLAISTVSVYRQDGAWLDSLLSAISVLHFVCLTCQVRCEPGFQDLAVASYTCIIQRLPDK